MHLRGQADCGGYIRGPYLALALNVGPGAAGVAKKLKPELLRLGCENALKLSQLRALFNRQKPGRSWLGCMVESRANAPPRMGQRSEPAILEIKSLFETRHSRFPPCSHIEQSTSFDAHLPRLPVKIQQNPVLRHIFGASKPCESLSRAATLPHCPSPARSDGRRPVCQASPPAELRWPSALGPEQA
jgi:hypothetical protein